jgi:four helix bundle protein
VKENKLADLSMGFSVEIVNLCKEMRGNFVLRNQLLRSGTSIGANIHEANYAQSKPDFISKFQIALKECYETEYWLQLLKRTGMIAHDTAVSLCEKSGTIRRILIASINTAKH